MQGHGATGRRQSAVAVGRELLATLISMGWGAHSWLAPLCRLDCLHESIYGLVFQHTIHYYLLIELENQEIESV
jgi:hypothetical protein